MTPRAAIAACVLVATGCSGYQEPIERSLQDGTPARAVVADVPVHGAWVRVVPRAGSESEPVEGELLAIDADHVWVDELGIVRELPRGGVAGVWLRGQFVESARMGVLWEWARWPQGIPARIAESAVRPY